MKTPLKHNAKLRMAIVTWAGILGLVQMAATVPAATLTVPNEFESTEGNSFLSVLPFPAAADVEYQQLFVSSQFGAFGPEGAFITSIGFRNETGVPFSHLIPDLEVRMSTTTREPSSLSPVLSANFGPDARTVFRGQFQLSACSRGEIVRLPLTTPFFYRPSDGNFLFSFKNYVQWSAAPGPSFDAHIYPGSGPYPVGGALFIPGEGGTAGAGGGVVAILQFEVIPEPGTCLLAVIASIAYGIVRKKGRHVAV